MEIKKYPKADLSQYRGLIFGFSMVVTLVIVNTAFNWKSYDDGTVQIQDRATNSFELLNEVPPTEIPPPPPPIVMQASVVEVPNEVEILDELKINIDIEMNEDTRVDKITVIPTLPVIEKEDTDAIFVIVETPAEPVGGMPAFYSYVGERIKYPAQARRMKMEGKVFIQFIVNKDGTLSDFTVVKGIGFGCDEEALRVLSAAPAWKPGKQRGNPVRQQMVLPIIFKLKEL